ncbi:MAG: hypothetical protein MUO73_05620 [Thermoplasmata archaeon]|nr:hypothetical protein [Thermoplasmata archaeon]
MVERTESGDLTLSQMFNTSDKILIVIIMIIMVLVVSLLCPQMYKAGQNTTQVSYFIGKNVGDQIISPNQPVYISGADDGYVLIARIDRSNIAEKYPVAGVAVEEIPIGARGKCLAVEVV